MAVRWTPEEVDLLRELSKACTATEAAEHFPNRTWKSVWKKAGALGLEFSTKRVWSNDEDRVIREYGERLSARDLCPLLKGKTEQQVHSRRHVLGVKVHPEVTAVARSKAQLGHASTRSKIDLSLTLETMDPVERSVMLGCLLGDGYLRHRTREAFMGCDHGAKQREYVEWKARMLPSLRPRLTRNKTTGCYGFATHSHPIFTNLRERMYEERNGRGKKVHLPGDVVRHLGWLGLLVWYLDDGNMGWSNLKYTPHGTMTIASTSTTTDELSSSCDLLNDRLGLSLYVRGPRDGKKQIVFPRVDWGRTLSAWEGLSTQLDLPRSMKYKMEREYTK